MLGSAEALLFGERSGRESTLIVATFEIQSALIVVDVCLRNCLSWIRGLTSPVSPIRQSSDFSNVQPEQNDD